MKKFLKRTMTLLVCGALGAGIYGFGPNLYVRFFGDETATWLSQRFTETLVEKNELIVNEIETTGQETVSLDAWLIGTVQKVDIPYTFRMCYTVDLSHAAVSSNENVIEVRIPSPEPAYQKLLVNEEGVKKSDWLYRLTPERYAEIKQQIEDKLFNEYSQNESIRQSAWNTAVSNLESLFATVATQSVLGKEFAVQVIADDTLPLTTAAP